MACCNFFCFPVHPITISRPPWDSFCSSHWYCSNQHWQPIGWCVLWGRTCCKFCCCDWRRLPKVKGHPLMSRCRIHYKLTSSVSGYNKASLIMLSCCRRKGIVCLRQQYCRNEMRLYKSCKLIQTEESKEGYGINRSSRPKNHITDFIGQFNWTSSRGILIKCFVAGNLLWVF